jgi:hypothetical protein
MDGTRKFLSKTEDIFAAGDRAPYVENPQKSGIKAIDCTVSHQMSPCDFQEMLHSTHVIIVDYNLPVVSCDRRGLTTLNSLKEVVDLEGISQPHS